MAMRVLRTQWLPEFKNTLNRYFLEIYNNFLEFFGDFLVFDLEEKFL